MSSAEALLEVTLEGVSGLYGLDLRLAFDPTLLEIRDADAGKDSVQVLPGQIPAPDFIVRNEADNASGTVWYAATQMNPREPASGSGVVCSFRVRGLAAGVSPIDIVAAELVDRAGNPLPVEMTGGEVTVALAAAIESTASPTPRPTARPTRTPTTPPTETVAPSATPEPEETAPEEAEATATPQAETPIPTATTAPTEAPPATPNPTAMPTSGVPPPAEQAPPEPSAYPENHATTVSAARSTPSAPPEQSMLLAAPAALDAPDPAATAAPTETSGGTSEPAAQTVPAAPAEPGARPLIPTTLFSGLLALTAVAAVALTAHLTRRGAPDASPISPRKMP